MCAAAVLFAVMNTLVKFLSSELNSLQIVWARTLGHLIFMAVLFLPRGGMNLLKTRRPGIHFLRSLLQILSTLLYFFALRYMQLAEATAISFLAPLLVTLLAAPMLGEKIEAARLLLVSLGFVGVLIIVRPGSEVFQWASLLILASSICYATYQILTRKVSASDAAETSAIYSASLGAVLTSSLVPFVWTNPASFTQVAMLLSLGVLGGLGHYCVACAVFNAPANIVSPFQYLQLFGAVLLGYLVFGSIPDRYTWAGAVLIIASGLYLGWSETKRHPRMA